MLVIRLQRTGKRNSPTFRVVVAEKARSAKKEFHEVLGHYLPTRDPSEFEVKQDRVVHWISQGAQPSETVARLLVRNGVKEAEKFVSRYSKKKPKKEPPPEEAAPPPPAPATESPAEEVPVEESPPAAEEKPVEESKEEAPQEAESAPEQGNAENEGDNENKDG